MIDGNQVATEDVRAVNEPGKNGALMSIQDLKVYFELRRFGFGHAGYVRAVDDVSFDVIHGEAIAVVGESGCGKSSLMKTILGLYRPTEGHVIFEGQRFRQDGRESIEMVSHPGWLRPAGSLWGFTSFYERPEDSL